MTVIRDHLARLGVIIYGSDASGTEWKSSLVIDTD